MSLPLSARGALLVEVVSDVPPAMTPAVEAVMIKAASSRYRPGVRGRGWLKRRATQTVDLLVGGVTGTVGRPGTLLLGRRIFSTRVLRWPPDTPLLAYVTEVAAPTGPADLSCTPSS
jgi:hypothetical protein